MGSPRQPGQLVHLNALRHDERETRRAEAWALRLEGNTVRQVAGNLNVSVGTAAQYLQETLAELREASHESAESWRQLQLDRLDAIVAAWLPVSRDSAHPEATRAAAIVVRAVEGQSRLLGLLQTTNEAPPVSAATAERSILEAMQESPALLAAVEREVARARKIQEAGAVAK